MNRTTINTRKEELKRLKSKTIPMTSYEISSYLVFVATLVFDRAVVEVVLVAV